MEAEEWERLIIWDRIAVDQQFAGRVEHSQFTTEQWELIMTAVELTIESPEGTPRLVADTTELPEVIPYLKSLPAQSPNAGTDSFGFLSSIRSLFSPSGTPSRGARDDDVLADATALANEYAQVLQSHLEATDKWDDIAEIAAPD